MGIEEKIDLDMLLVESSEELVIPCRVVFSVLVVVLLKDGGIVVF